MRRMLKQVGTRPGNKHNGNYDAPVYRVVYVDSKKNQEFVEKRRKIGEAATKMLGVTCFG